MKGEEQQGSTTGTKKENNMPCGKKSHQLVSRWSMRANSLVGDLNRVLTMVSLVSWGLSTEATRLAFQATITFLLYLMCLRISLICARLNEQQRKPGITPLAGSAKMDAGASLPQASAASDDHAWMPSRRVA